LDQLPLEAEFYFFHFLVETKELSQFGGIEKKKEKELSFWRELLQFCVRKLKN